MHGTIWARLRELKKWHMRGDDNIVRSRRKIAVDDTRLRDKAKERDFFSGVTRADERRKILQGFDRKTPERQRHCAREIYREGIITAKQTAGN